MKLILLFVINIYAIRLGNEDDVMSEKELAKSEENLKNLEA